MHTLRAGLATLGALFLATAPGASADMTQQKQELIRELVAASGGAIPTERVTAMLPATQKVSPLSFILRPTSLGQ